ncbi:MAG: RodZ domain-containing protein [Succinivibrio sp.]
MSSKKFRGLRNRQDRFRTFDRNRNEEAGQQMSNVEDKSVDSKTEVSSDNSDTLNTIISEGFSATADEVENTMPMMDESEKDLAEENSVSNEAVADNSQDLRESVTPSNDSMPNLYANSQVDPELAEDLDKIPVSTTLPDDKVPNRPGAILRHAREILGKSMSEVANTLNVRANVICDLEYDRFCQTSAVPFASKIITEYAKLVNINPELLLKSYMDCVLEAAADGQQKARENQRLEKKAKVFSIKSLALLVASVAFLILAVAVAYSVFSKEKPQSTGSLVLNNTVVPDEKEDGSIVVNTSNTKVRTTIEEPEVLGVDENTLKARELNSAINGDAIISEKNQGKVETKVKAQSEVMKLSVKGQDEKFVKKTEAKTKEEKKTAEVIEDVIDVEVAPVEDIKAELKSAEIAVVPAEEKQTVKPAEKEVKAEVKKEEASPKLSASLKDISSSVRFATKTDPLAGTNSVEIKVSGDVYLKVTGNGRTVKEGVFKAGQSVKAIGIPPLKVSVSDSSKITVTYIGGRLALPASKQVTFELPKR